MAQASYKQSIPISWFTWHFFEMPVFLFEAWKNYLSFGIDYFSIPLLLKTLLSPWRQYRWRYPRGFDIGGYVGTFISNMFSRALGAVARVVLVLAGIVTQLVIVIAGMVAIAVWLVMPFVFIFLIWFLATLAV